MSFQQEQEQCQFTFTTVFEVTTCANKKKSSHMSNYTGQYNHSVRRNTNPQHNDAVVPITRIHTAHAQCQHHWMCLCQLRHNCSRQCQRTYTDNTDIHIQDQRNRHISADKEAQGNFCVQQQTHHVNWHRKPPISADSDTAPTWPCWSAEKSMTTHLQPQQALSTYTVSAQCQQALCLSRYREPHSHDSSMNRGDIKDTE